MEIHSKNLEVQVFLVKLGTRVPDCNDTYRH